MSLVVVQPLLAIGLLGLVLASRLVLGEAVGARQFWGAVLVAIGVTLVVVGAPSGSVTLSADFWTVLTAIVLGTVLAFPQFASGSGALCLGATIHHTRSLGHREVDPDHARSLGREGLDAGQSRSLGRDEVDESLRGG